MYYLTWLPDELIIDIILRCNYKQIITLTTICKRFNNIITDKQILKQRSNIGFPRIEGKAKVHKIPRKVVCNSKLTIIDDLVMTYIITNEIEVINGDILDFSKDFSSSKSLAKAIFKDFNVIQMENNYYPIIPACFQVIGSNIPLYYWYTDMNSTNNINTFWFNPTIVKDQCLSNITFGNPISTTFTLNNINYTILLLLKFSRSKSTNDEIKMKCDKLFSSNKLLLFNLCRTDNNLILKDV